LQRAIKAGHESVLEHINLTYEIRNLSRACLQELARHRHISLSVESTRHTLKERAKEIGEATRQLDLSEGAWSAFDIVVKIITERPEITNDELKYYIPECWPTNLVMTVNVRELRHILKLRTSPAALKEFQELAHKLFEAVPDEFKYLLEDCVLSEFTPKSERLGRLITNAPKMYEAIKFIQNMAVELGVSLETNKKTHFDVVKDIAFISAVCFEVLEKIDGNE